MQGATVIDEVFTSMNVPPIQICLRECKKFTLSLEPFFTDVITSESIAASDDRKMSQYRYTIGHSNPGRRSNGDC